MCGIVGYCRNGGSMSLSRETLERMTASLGHRGPDGVGYYTDETVGLGHTRLSIIDLAGGAQPIHNEDKSLWIVFNGEIYNYIELRMELVKKGHRFSTTTDTEVILHLYEEEGEKCLERLNGQFAFAIRDVKESCLFLARDRFGILPLHYAASNGFLLFASEVKAIFHSGLIDRRIDPIGFDQIFTFWSTLSGRTAFQGVWEIPPGCWLKVSDGERTLKKYWDLPLFPAGEKNDRAIGELSEELAELLEDAVRIRLRADVPVGCYISGGLDSSGVTALVKKKFNNQLRTFGIRFDAKEFDESEHQDFIVSCLATDHTSILAGNEEIGARFPDVIWHAEKPLLRTAPVPLFLLSGTVQQAGYKVVLTGEGADEVFGGYDIFKEAKIRKFWARCPDSRSRPLLLGKLYPDILKDKRLSANLEKFFGAGLEKFEDPLFSHLIRWKNTSRIKAFFSQEFRDAVGEYSGYDEVRQTLPSGFDGWDALSKSQYIETSIFLSNYLLSSQGDRVSMAHGVEIRPPYLDHRIIRFMRGVPPWWKINGLNEKYLLKRSLEPILPGRIVNRHKHPYRAPITQSLLSDREGRYSWREVMSESALREAGIFDPKRVELLIRKLKASPYPGEFDSMALAGIYSAQILHEQYIKDFSFVADQNPRISTRNISHRYAGYLNTTTCRK
jgi:asparagine synthase (glutamine-hydrolysing)